MTEDVLNVGHGRDPSQHQSDLRRVWPSRWASAWSERGVSGDGQLPQPCRVSGAGSRATFPRARADARGLVRRRGRRVGVPGGAGGEVGAPGPPSARGAALPARPKGGGGRAVRPRVFRSFLTSPPTCTQGSALPAFLEPPSPARPCSGGSSPPGGLPLWSCVPGCGVSSLPSAVSILTNDGSTEAEVTINLQCRAGIGMPPLLIHFTAWTSY